MTKGIITTIALVLILFIVSAFIFGLVCLFKGGDDSDNEQ